MGRLERLLYVSRIRRKNMHIFPSLSSQSGSSASTGLSMEASLLTLGNGNLGNIFGAFLNSARDEAHDNARDNFQLMEWTQQQAAFHDQHHQEVPPLREPERRSPAEQESARGDDQIISRHLDKPVNREDFAELRQKLEDMGVDRETLDRLEDVFESNETVTWRQVLDILREPLEELANIKLTPEQEKNLISLLEKIGFTPDDALALTRDILDKNLDAVFSRIDELLSSLSADARFSFSSSEILAFMKALGLMGNSKASGGLDPTLGKFFGLSEDHFEKIDPQTAEALRALAAAMKKAGMEMTPELRSVLHKALQENADLLLRITNAVTKGDLKLTPETLAAFQNALQQSSGGSPVDPQTTVTLRALAEAMKKAGMEMTPELRSVLHKALQENADLLLRITNAVTKGDLKLTPETLAAFQNALQQSSGGSSSNLEQILRQATESELTPEELQKILGMIKEASVGSDQDRNRLFVEIQRILTGSDNRDLRMQAADNGPNAQRMSMTEAVNALKAAATEGDGKNRGSMDRHANQGSQWENPNAQRKSAQGWESFWNKISVQGSGDVSGGLLKDAGPDPRSILGQTSASTTAEAAARRVLSNAPAPHRALLNQVHSGLLQNLGQGRQQLTLQLHPAELGSLTVNLRVVGKEVQAMLRAENPEARQIIAENLPLLRQSLESQGLRVTRLDVQTQFSDQNQNQFTQLWQGSDGQKFQEQGAKTQWTALGRNGGRNKGGDGLEASEQASILQNSPREGGINLIA
ncbi:MAG: flagellar hook-length control protein FliK [Desulfovibrionales bacterium]|nr:MAG: flagellar hook-length control protein FliK [Desulfovibrionales bacterium]